MPPQMESKVKEEVAALNLGNKIRNLRKQRALTLQEVSDITGLSKPLLSQIENNIAAPPHRHPDQDIHGTGGQDLSFFQGPEHG